jgi:hypothetical protein
MIQTTSFGMEIPPWRIVPADQVLASPRGRADRAAHETALRANLLSLDTTRTRHVGSDPHVERYDPDLWTDEFAFLTRPGEADMPRTSRA